MLRAHLLWPTSCRTKGLQRQTNILAHSRVKWAFGFTSPWQESGASRNSIILSCVVVVHLTRRATMLNLGKISMQLPLAAENCVRESCRAAPCSMEPVPVPSQQRERKLSKSVLPALPAPRPECAADVCNQRIVTNVRTALARHALQLFMSSSRYRTS